MTRSRLMGKGHDDAHDRTHVGWKRDMKLTLIAGQELPEVLFGDCSLEVRVRQRQRRRWRAGGYDDGVGDGVGVEGEGGGGYGVRFSFCALDALRCWALLNHPPPPHLSELRK